MTLYTKLSRLQWLLQRNHMQNHAERGPMADPTRGQGRVLAMLKLQPEITTKDLGYLLGIRQQSLNELLNKLEKGGYVTRIPSEEDRRVMVVTLTEKGKGEEWPQSGFDHIFDCLTEEEQAAFGEYLDRVIAVLDDQLGEEADGEEMSRWMRAARERMGDEQFETLMAMRGGPHRHDRHLGREFGGFGRCSHGHAPHGMPGAERLEPGYDGPMPDGRGPHPFARRGGCPHNPPSSPHEERWADHDSPIPPKGPQEPNDD